MLKCTHVLKLLRKEVPEVGSCSTKHVAVRDMTLLKCCVFVWLRYSETQRDASE